MGLFRCGVACVWALSSSVASAACDPKEPPPVGDNGPTFLVVGVAQAQPPETDAGTTLFVQSRGGNYIGIRTIGCTHAFGPYSGVTSSCGQSPYFSSQPLYLTADPEDQPCNVDVRLYSICDCLEGGIPYDYTNGPSVFEWCDSVGTLVSSQAITLGVAPDASLDVAEAGVGDGAGDASPPSETGDLE
jgi:hypothetical protein